MTDRRASGFKTAFLIGIAACVFATLVEAFIAFAPRLYALWPWLGFNIYLPGILSLFLATYWLWDHFTKKGVTFPQGSGLYAGLAAMLTFFFFDNMFIFPIFVARGVPRWRQQFFYYYFFPEGLVDTLENAFFYLMAGGPLVEAFFPRGEASKRLKGIARKVSTVSGILFLLIFALTLFLLLSGQVESFLRNLAYGVAAISFFFGVGPTFLGEKIGKRKNARAWLTLVFIAVIFSYIACSSSVFGVTFYVLYNPHVVQAPNIGWLIPLWMMILAPNIEVWISLTCLSFLFVLGPLRTE